MIPNKAFEWEDSLDKKHVVYEWKVFWSLLTTSYQRSFLSELRGLYLTALPGLLERDLNQLLWEGELMVNHRNCPQKKIQSIYPRFNQLCTNTSTWSIFNFKLIYRAWWISAPSDNFPQNLQTKIPHKSISKLNCNRFFGFKTTFEFNLLNWNWSNESMLILTLELENLKFEIRWFCFVLDSPQTHFSVQPPTERHLFQSCASNEMIIAKVISNWRCPPTINYKYFNILL